MVSEGFEEHRDKIVRSRGVPAEVVEPEPLEVQALKAVLIEDGIEARETVKAMGRADRAVLDFWLHELSNIIDDVQMGDRL